MYNLTASQGFCNLSTTDKPRKGNRTSGEEQTHNICLLKMFIIMNGWMYKEMLSFTARALAINYGTQTRKSNIAGLACKIRIDKWCLNIFYFDFLSWWRLLTTMIALQSWYQLRLYEPLSRRYAWDVFFFPSFCGTFICCEEKNWVRM